MGTETRVRQNQVKLRLSNEELAVTKQKASACGLSVPGYLREIAVTGTAPKLDKFLVRKLCSELKSIRNDLEIMFNFQERKTYPKINFTETVVALERLTGIVEKALKDEEG